MALINQELIKLARFTAGGGTWAQSGTIEKAAIVPPGGGDPSGGGGPPPGGDPSGGGLPPGGDPSGGGGPPPGVAPPGADPTGGAGGAAPGGPPPGPMDPAALQQIVMAVQQATGGGAGGKGKSPKDQLQASQTKIQIHLLAQIASKMGIQVDPQMLVPPSDPSSDQMAMQELQSAPMLPSTDPNAQGAGGAAGGAPGGAPGGGAPPGGGDAGGGMGGGPGPIQPMDAGQGPIGGKTASFLGRLFDPDAEAAIGREYNILPKIRENRQKAAAQMAIFRALSR